MNRPNDVQIPLAAQESDAAARESAIAQDISQALDAILAYAYTLDQDLPLTQKWPAFPPRASEAERRGLDVFDSNRLSKQLHERHANRISWKNQL